MENSMLLLVLCILMSSCVLLGVSSSFDTDLGDYLGKLASGEQGTSTCMNKLMPCQPFLVPGPVQPSANCCIPLQEIVANNTECICQAFDNPIIMATLNVSKEDVLKLPRACNATFEESSCKTAAGGGSAGSGSGTLSSTSSGSGSPKTDSATSPEADATPEADTTPEADSKSSGANGMLFSFGCQYLSLSFFVAFILSVY